MLWAGVILGIELYNYIFYLIIYLRVYYNKFLYKKIVTIIL